MAVEIAATRVAVDFVWDTTVVTGAEASLILNGTEMRIVANDGEAAFVFPLDFNGEVEVTVRGSESGEETGILEVVSPLFNTPAVDEGTDDTSEVEVTTPPVPEPTVPDANPDEPLPDVPVDPTSEPLPEEPPTDVPAPTEPEGSDVPIDSESEIPDDASSEIGSGEVSPVVPDDPALPSNEPAEDVGITPQEGDASGAVTSS